MYRFHLVIVLSATVALTVAIATEPHANDGPTPRPNGAVKADRLDADARRDPCRSEAWPYISGECVSLGNRVEEPRLATRTVTIEQRPQPGVSVLTRVPVDAVAER